MLSSRLGGGAEKEKCEDFDPHGSKSSILSISDWLLSSPGPGASVYHPSSRSLPFPCSCSCRRSHCRHSCNHLYPCTSYAPYIRGIRPFPSRRGHPQCLWL